MKARRGVFRRRWAWPLAPVYAAVLAVKDGLRRVGVVPVRRLEWPVVSVGSLSAGGAGKTPVTIALAELLRERGWGVDVLSRGYGRAGSGVERVDAGMEGAAARFGVPVVMGSSFENFRDIVAKMQGCDGIRIVQDKDALESTLVELLTDRDAAKAMGERGRKVFEAQQGATGQAVEALVGMVRP